MMKRMTALIILILIFSIPVLAPGEKVFYLLKEPSVNVYETLIKAVVKVESNGNNNAYNALENACGAFQIRQCRVDHYNRLKRTNFVLTDFYDYELSRQMFLYFCKDRDYESVAKSWNGSGPLTKIYWQKVKARL